MSTEQSNYQFTELQEKWLQALESGEYRQTTNVLFDPEDGGYCCLGVACLVSGEKFDENGECLGKLKSLPVKVQDALKLRDSEGQCTQGIRIPGLNTHFLLTTANDSGATFAQLAAFIRANPEKVFLP